MDVKAYAERIHYHGSIFPNAESLRDLQLAHLLSVPFENLSILAGEPILLEEDSLFDKIVVRQRGGFCYELNGLFAALLRQLGFHVKLLSARVAKDDGSFGPDFDHMALMVLLEDRWLVDVGFGDSFRQPLLIDDRHVQAQGDRSYRIDEHGKEFILSESIAGSTWKAQYAFTLQSRSTADYAERCHYHQTSPESNFTQRRICSMATPDGRLTLSDMRHIETVSREKREQTVMNEEEYALLLRTKFGVVMKK